MTTEAWMKMAITRPLRAIFEDYPVCRDFFLNLRLDDLDWDLPLTEALEKVDQEVIDEFGMETGLVFCDFCEFLETFGKGNEKKEEIRSVTVIGGRGKSGEAETLSLTVSVGEVVSIVGPTGAGKSRLLADIECLADGDTPTGRKILIDERRLTEEERFCMEGKLVAQLSQNMNFVMDLTVREFLEMHALSRMSAQAEETIERCFQAANDLAGEKFTWDVKVTQLSGGQSRALMIADTAYMSASPIVLIDEIENAGIDRRKAIEVLTGEEKMVFISTHDPLLALGADKRVVIQNGSVIKVIRTTEEEKHCLVSIEKLDNRLQELRNCLRRGEEIRMEMMEEE